MQRPLFAATEASTRRHFLGQTACGFGALAAAGLLGQESRGQDDWPLGGVHHAARAKRIIFLFMQGGVSQVDSFDRKSVLEQRDGEQVNFNDARQLANTGMGQGLQRLMKGPWEFRSYGESGLEVSDLFAHMGRHADDLCVVRSLHTEGVAHGPATLFLHCGSTNTIRPSMGSWVLYGLGPDNNNLPGFVSISPSVGNGGARNYGSAFLPAAVQGTSIGRPGSNGRDLMIRHLNDERSREQQRRQLDLLETLNHQQRERMGGSSELDAVLDSYELAWRMQEAAPEVFDLADESAETLTAYGIDDPVTEGYGRRCLLARRLCEAGVRFIQVNYGDNSANPAWDQHSDLPKHENHARACDRPIAALLNDLKQRGLLEDTIVWWGSEFGRTPYAQKNGTGRDHNPGGFTVCLAGGGLKPGFVYGSTDEFGHQAIENKVHMHDLHASLLHLLGIDHERLTYRYAGRDFRLTDIHGRVVHDLFA